MPDHRCLARLPHAVTPAVVTCLVAVVALTAAGASWALQRPGRAMTRAGAVSQVALNRASLAFVVGRSAADCDHVELWNLASRATWRFGRPGPCTNLGSTGNGITAVGVSGNRVLWIRYAGGNLRDWQLMTATTTQRVPRQIRFVEQDVDLPSPFRIGDATADGGIPYSTGNEVVLLGRNGAAVFKHVESANVVAVTGGRGPGGIVVAALLETGEIVAHRADGSVAYTLAYAPGAVRAIAIAPAGVVAQMPGAVEIRDGARTTTIRLPSGAVMTDYARGRLLYVRANETHARGVVDGKDTLLLRGTTAAPVRASYDTYGLAWTRGRTVSFACAACIPSAA